MKRSAGEVRFDMVCDVCRTPGAPPTPVYGIRARSSHGERIWPDVADSPQAVAVLLSRLRREAPEPCHFDEISEDYVGELAQQEPSEMKACAFCENRQKNLALRLCI